MSETDHLTFAAKIGALEADMHSVKGDIDELKKDMKTLLAFVNQTKGGWKTIVLVAGVSSAVTAALFKVAPLMAWFK